MFGSFFPSKAVQLTLTAPVPQPFQGLTTVSVTGSLVWYITANSVSSPGSFSARITNPLGPANPGMSILFCSGDGDDIAQEFGIFVKLTPDAARFPTNYPKKPFWANAAQFLDVWEDAASGKRMVVMGTDSASDIFLVDETLASIVAAVNAAAAGTSAPRIQTAAPTGNNQANARQVLIPSTGTEHVVRTIGIAAVNSGIRIDMVDGSGTLIAPVPGTLVRIKHDSAGQAVFVYPGVGYSFANTAINTPILLFSQLDIVLFCYEPGQWNISSNTTSELRTQLIQPNDQLDYMAIGNGNSPGVLVTGSGATPADPMLCVGVTDNGFGYDPEGLTLIGSGAVAATAMGDNSFRIGGAGGGFEGKLVSRAYPVVAADIATEIAPALLIDITSSTGASPAIQFNGNKGSISYVANNAPVSVGVKDVGGALIGLVIPAGSAAHYISFDEGAAWTQVSIFTL